MSDIHNDDRLEKLQETIHDALKETTFGKPINLDVGGNTIVYRRRQYEGRPDSVTYEVTREDAKKAQHKRSKAQTESWKKFATPGKKTLLERGSEGKLRLTASSDEYETGLKGSFPLAYELVEYVQGGGSMDNVSRMTQLKPPKIHGIEDIADSIDWHLLKKGINSEHIETALSKDGNQVLLFMDDRAKTRLPQIKEILTKFGDPRILQKAEDMNETTSQPHGFYVFELTPDTALYTPKKEMTPSADLGDWESDRQQDMQDSLVDEEAAYNALLESTFEPFCSTCGDKLFETDSKSEMAAKVKFGKKAKKLDKKGLPKPAGTGTTYNMDSLEDEDNDFVEMCGPDHKDKKKKNDPEKDDDYEDSDDEMEKNKSSEAFDARVGDPKGKKKKDHKSTVGDSIDFNCESCSTKATEIDEHAFKGYYCARHGERLDKYSRACYECQEDQKTLDNLVVACPDCNSVTTLESLDCGVCGTVFVEGEVTDYAGNLSDVLAPYDTDDEVVEGEYDWEDNRSFAEELGNTLFSDVESDSPF
jgi:hypothetical protein